MDMDLAETVKHFAKKYHTQKYSLSLFKKKHFLNSFLINPKVNLRPTSIEPISFDHKSIQ